MSDFSPYYFFTVLSNRTWISEQLAELRRFRIQMIDPNNLFDVIVYAIGLVMCLRVAFWIIWLFGSWLLKQWINWFFTVVNLVLLLFCFLLLYLDPEDIQNTFTFVINTVY